MPLIECRICDNCGTQNDPGQLECTKCGCDLSFLPISTVDDSLPCPSNPLITEKEHISESKWSIVAKENSALVLQISDSVLIGRDNNDALNGYFSSSTFISREHATLLVDQDVLYVIDASTNGTFINGTRINKMKKYKLENGDNITFADKEFIVRYAN